MSTKKQPRPGGHPGRGPDAPQEHQDTAEERPAPSPLERVRRALHRSWLRGEAGSNRRELHADICALNALSDFEARGGRLGPDSIPADAAEVERGRRVLARELKREARGRRGGAA